MNLKNVIFSILLVFSLLVVFGCSQKDDKYGKEISLEESTKIGELLSNPKDYEGKIVRVEGEIITECPTGCWFDLKDETGVIYVNIRPAGFAIPQRLRQDAIVEGTFTSKETSPTILGIGVQIK